MRRIIEGAIISDPIHGIAMIARRLKYDYNKRYCNRVGHPCPLRNICKAHGGDGWDPEKGEKKCEGWKE